MAVGVPYETFWHLNPKGLTAFYEGYSIKRKMQDEQMWILGQYFMSALDATVCNAILWRRKNEKSHTYIEKPILQQKNKNATKQLTEEERQREVDLFFKREDERRRKWQRNHRLKDDSVS